MKKNRRAAVLTATAVAVLGGAVASPAHAGVQTPTKDERGFVHLVNTHRAKLGLKKVQISPVLTGIADDHAIKLDAMATPDHSYDAQFIKPANASGCSKWSGPVITWGSGSKSDMTPKDAYDSWMGSAPHKKVIQDPQVTHIGPGERGNVWLAYLMVCSGKQHDSGDYGAPVRTLRVPNTKLRWHLPIAPKLIK